MAVSHVGMINAGSILAGSKDHPLIDVAVLKRRPWNYRLIWAT